MKTALLLCAVIVLLVVASFAGGEPDVDSPVRLILKSEGKWSDEMIEGFLALPRFPQIEASTGKFQSCTQLCILPRAAILYTFTSRPDRPGGYYTSEVLYDYTRNKKGN